MLKNNPKLAIEVVLRDRLISRAKQRKIVKTPKHEVMMRNWTFPLLNTLLIRHHGYTNTDQESTRSKFAEFNF